MKTNIFKKAISSAILALMCLSFTTAFVQADSGQSSSFSYNVNSNNNGGVNGFSNSRFYSLTPGNVTYDLTTLSGNGSKNGDYYVYFELWRHEYTTQNPTYGEHYYYGIEYTNTPARLEFNNLPASSSRYYFKIHGGSSGQTISGSGTVHDHGTAWF